MKKNLLAITCLTLSIILLSGCGAKKKSLQIVKTTAPPTATSAPLPRYPRFCRRPYPHLYRRLLSPLLSSRSKLDFQRSPRIPLMRPCL